MKILLKLFTLLQLSFLISCGHIQEDNLKNYKTDEPLQKVYKGFTKEQVWKAAQICLQHYPLLKNDPEAGIMETEDVKYDTGWTSPTQEAPPPSGRRYKIQIRHVAGTNQKGEELHVLKIKKVISLKRDIVSAEEELPSDGLEELSILYRIERTLKIERALDRLQQKEM